MARVLLSGGTVGAGRGEVGGAVFVDAILPHPGQTWFDTAPAATGRAPGQAGPETGGCPGGTTSGSRPEAVSALLPEAQGLQERFAADLPELHAGVFLRDRACKVACWPPAHCAYLRLSEPYDEFADEADRLGWPVYRENSDHLAMLTQPDRVAVILHRMGVR